MKNDAISHLIAFVGASLIDAAGEQYADALGVDYKERRTAFLEEANANVESALNEAKRTLDLARFAGVENPKAGDLMAGTLAAVAFRAAAKIFGEPPADQAKDEAAEEAAQ